jgi:hypothetical protein
MAMGDAVLNQKDFDPRARELVILAVMAVYDVPFVLYAHTRIAMKLGLSEGQVSSASKGTTPKGSQKRKLSYIRQLWNWRRLGVLWTRSLGWQLRRRWGERNVLVLRM